MSHEIRTPLSAILGFAELAVRPGSSVAQKDQYLEVIVKNGKRLLTLINDLLDISKIEAGKVELRKMDFSWKDVVAEVVELLKPSCVAKGVKMLADQPSEIPAGLYSDSHHFHRILLNMVGNAVKFTEKGKVEIKARTEVRDGTNWLKISVIDSGVGIDVASQANLFKPFSQAEGGRKFGGTGLGLNLSRTLAKALGGDLIMEYSTLGEGSTFSLILPYLRAAAQITIPKSAIGPRKKRAHNLSVLLIEDSDDNRFLIQEFLQSDGIKVDTANDGKQGLEKALAGEHDAVLMDIQMPVMDGIEATRRLRDFGYRKPIIALTASAMGEEKAKGLGYGFDTYLTKPVNRERLLSTLSALE